MALFTTDFGFPQIGVALSTHTFLAHGIRLRLFERRGVHVNDGILRAVVGSAEPQKWPTLAFSLEGPTHAVAPGRCIEIARGDMLIGHAYRELGEVHGDDPHRSLVLQWDPQVFGVKPDALVETGHLVAAEFDAVKSLASIIQAGGPTPRIIMQVATLLQRLSALGLAVPSRDVAAVVMHGAPFDKNVAASLTAAFSTQRGLPSIVDVQQELRRSRADVHRRLSSFLEQGCFAIGSWAALRAVVTLSAAGTLMTARKARTEDVAKRLGYSSPTALCRAFARAGLPSPGKMRAHVLRSS